MLHFADESARHCQKLQQLLMLVPGLANLSIASIRAALQKVNTPALSGEAHMRLLEAAGALIQQLCQAEITQVSFGHHCGQLQKPAKDAVQQCLACLEQTMLDSHDSKVWSACQVHSLHSQHWNLSLELVDGTCLQLFM